MRVPGLAGRDVDRRRTARERFAIHGGERVLDVGCGASPFTLATHLCDVTWAENEGRLLHAPPPATARFFQARVEALPVADKAFDFVYCAHVLEHVPDPAAACRELSRVARRGYIECPASWIERLFHSPDHRWLVDHEGGRLTFRELLDDECRDVLGVQYEILPMLENPDFADYWNRPDVRRGRLVEFYWEGRIDCAVIPRAQRKHAGTLRWFYGPGDDGPAGDADGGAPAPLRIRDAWRRP